MLRCEVADAVDFERMVWLWDVTTVQGKAIIEAKRMRGCDVTHSA